MPVSRRGDARSCVLLPEFASDAVCLGSSQDFDGSDQTPPFPVATAGRVPVSLSRLVVHGTQHVLGPRLHHPGHRQRLRSAPQQTVALSSRQAGLGAGTAPAPRGPPAPCATPRWADRSPSGPRSPSAFPASACSLSAGNDLVDGDVVRQLRGQGAGQRPQAGLCRRVGKAAGARSRLPEPIMMIFPASAPSRYGIASRGSGRRPGVDVEQVRPDRRIAFRHRGLVPSRASALFATRMSRRPLPSRPTSNRRRTSSGSVTSAVTARAPPPCATIRSATAFTSPAVAPCRRRTRLPGHRQAIPLPIPRPRRSRGRPFLQSHLRARSRQPIRQRLPNDLALPDDDFHSHANPRHLDRRLGTPPWRTCTSGTRRTSGS